MHGLNFKGGVHESTVDVPAGAAYVGAAFVFVVWDSEDVWVGWGRVLVESWFNFAEPVAYVDLGLGADVFAAVAEHQQPVFMHIVHYLFLHI